MLQRYSHFEIKDNKKGAFTLCRITAKKAKIEQEYKRKRCTLNPKQLDK